MKLTNPMGKFSAFWKEIFLMSNTFSHRKSFLNISMGRIQKDAHDYSIRKQKFSHKNSFFEISMGISQEKQGLDIIRINKIPIEN